MNIKQFQQSQNLFSSTYVNGFCQLHNACSIYFEIRSTVYYRLVGRYFVLPTDISEHQI